MAKTLGQLLTGARERKGLSMRAVAREAEMSNTTIIRIENNTIQPTPETLGKLASILDLPLSRLYKLAGYPVPKELPSLPAYLRTKYRDLPAPARKELTRYIEKLKDKYGLDENGPKNGEDET
jgi:transcriptional regulator with XRE-family HTH domain